MKNVIAFALMLSMTMLTSTAFATNSVPGLNADDAAGVRICWTTKKGKRICIGVTVDFKLQDLFSDSGIKLDGMEGETLMLSGFNPKLNGESFLIEKPQKIGDNLFAQPGKYSIENGSTQLRVGPPEGK